MNRSFIIFEQLFNKNDGIEVCAAKTMIKSIIRSINDSIKQYLALPSHVLREDDKKNSTKILLIIFY